MTLDIDDLIERIENDWNFKEAKETCGNCKHAEWDYDGGECIELTKRLKELYVIFVKDGLVGAVPENLVKIYISQNDRCNLYTQKD
jgi:hypothetical protein